MLRKIFIATLCGILLVSISSCSWKVSADEIVFAEVDILWVEDDNLQKTLDSEIEDGVYSLQTFSKYYIIFNGNENIYKDIYYKISGKSLEVMFNKDENVGINQIVYEVVLPENIDTIKLFQNGESIPFKSIIINQSVGH